MNKTNEGSSQKIIFLSGLPGSGKTSWAQTYCFNDLNTVRLNKDDIRKELGNEPFSKKFEELVLSTQRDRGLICLDEGRSIIIDDTNFHPKHKTYWSEIAKKLQVGFEEIFIDVPLAQCIKNDLERDSPVGEKVIREMYNKYLKKDKLFTDQRTILIQDELLKPVILVDLDGTIALINGRNIFDTSKVYTDKVNTPVAKILERYNRANVEVIYVSGRSDISRTSTENWLKANNLWFSENQQLFMRRDKDFRNDYIVKKELYEHHIEGIYFIEFVLDDRSSVVKLWRDLGLLCLQVYYGDF
jgi:predicted kinase